MTNQTDLAAWCCCWPGCARLTRGWLCTEHVAAADLKPAPPAAAPALPREADPPARSRAAD